MSEPTVDDIRQKLLSFEGDEMDGYEYFYQAAKVLLAQYDAETARADRAQADAAAWKQTAGLAWQANGQAELLAALAACDKPVVDRTIELCQTFVYLIQGSTPVILAQLPTEMGGDARCRQIPIRVIPKNGDDSNKTSFNLWRTAVWIRRTPIHLRSY